MRRLALSLAIAVLCLQVQARDSGAEFREWFASVADADGDLCIHMGRPRVVRDAHWRCVDDAGPCAIAIDGEWQPVPDVAITEDQNRIGPAVVWTAASGAIVCFMAGVKT